MFSGILLAKWRERKGWTQVQLARALGVGQPAIAKLEAGQQRSLRRAAAEKLEKLSDGTFRAEEILLARFGMTATNARRVPSLEGGRSNRSAGASRRRGASRTTSSS